MNVNPSAGAGVNADEEPVRWRERLRREARVLALAVAVQAVLAVVLGVALVRRAADAPVVVAVGGDGTVWGGERQPFRPDGRMIEAWLRRVTGVLAADPEAARQAGWVTAEVASAWMRNAGSGRGGVAWRELRVKRQGAEGLVVDVRLGWPVGGVGWLDDRWLRLTVHRGVSSASHPLGLVVADTAWLTAAEAEEGERRAALRRRLGLAAEAPAGAGGVP